MVLEKTLESPLDGKEIKPVNPKGNQPWIFIGRTDIEAEAPILWPPDAKSRLTGKDPDARKDLGQEEKMATEDETVGWHHQVNGHESEQTLEDSEVQETWRATVHGVAKSLRWLSDWITTWTVTIKKKNLKSKWCYHHLIKASHNKKWQDITTNCWMNKGNTTFQQVTGAGTRTPKTCYLIRTEPCSHQATPTC